MTNRFTGLALRICIFLSVATVVAGCSFASQTRQKVNLLTPAVMPVEAIDAQAPPAVPNVVAGAATYISKCQACHGTTGLGDGPNASAVRQQGGQVPRLADPALRDGARLTDWYDAVSNGRTQNLMPSFASVLTTQQRWDVLSYVWSLGVTSQTIQAGSALYADDCTSCHGANDEGNGPQTQTLPKNTKIGDLSDPKYLASHSLNDVATAMDQGSVHQPLQLTNQQRIQIAEYLDSLAFPYTDTTTLRQQLSIGQGSLRLQAVNLTPNGKPISALPVTLHIYDTMGEVYSQTAKLNSRGVVTFTGLITADNYFYQASTLYEGARLYAEPAQFSGTLSISATLPVYEVTTDRSVIHISQFHYFVQGVTDGAVTVVEYYVFDNTSNHAYIDKPGPNGQLRTLQVTVPDAATNLHFEGPGIGDRYSRVGNIIYDSDAVPPGQASSTIVMIYSLPYQGGLQIQRSVAYPVDSWDVLLQDGAMHAIGLTDKGVQHLQSGNIHVYLPEQPKVPANGTINFGLSGIQNAVSQPGTNGTAVGIGLVALSLAALFGYLLITHTRAENKKSLEPASDRQVLLQQIATLDTQYAQGEVKTPDYQRERDELMDRLREIWQ